MPVLREQAKGHAGIVVKGDVQKARHQHAAVPGRRIDQHQLGRPRDHKRGGGGGDQCSLLRLRHATHLGDCIGSVPDARATKKAPEMPAPFSFVLI
jgi:hypothetical protein